MRMSFRTVDWPHEQHGSVNERRKVAIDYVMKKAERYDLHLQAIHSFYRTF